MGLYGGACLLCLQMLRLSEAVLNDLKFLIKSTKVLPLRGSFFNAFNLDKAQAL